MSWEIQEVHLRSQQRNVVTNMANPMKIIKGAQKATNLAKRINNSAQKTRKMGGAYASVNSKGKLEVRENMTDRKVKGKVKNIRDNAQMLELNAKSGSKEKKVTSLKYPSKNYFKKIKEKTPKVPVKRRGN